MQVFVDSVWVYLSGKFIEVDGQLGQMTTIARDRTLTLAGGYNFLLKLGNQFGKTCYIRTGSLEVIFLSAYRVGFS